MNIKTKTHACLKSDGDGFPLAEDGTFEAIVSVFNVVDSVRDIVMPGAFADSLNTWSERHSKHGNNLPVLWSHRMDDPRYNIGYVLSAAELGPGDERIPKSSSSEVHANGGLWIRGQLDIDEGASDIAKAARRLLQARRVVQFSFAYDVVQYKVTDDNITELHQLWLHEVSPTQVGAHRMTDLGHAKAAPTDGPKAHRTSVQDLRLRCEIAANLYGR